MGALPQLAYENALRALDKQEGVLEELRARTGILLAASSLAASLLGREAFANLHPLVLVLIALGSFLTAVGACLFILVPRTGFVFALKGPAIYEELFEFGEQPDEIHRRLAYDLQRFWDENDERLTPVLRAFKLAAVTSAIEVLALALLVSGTFT